jgi:purine-cytosine permease-like protein
MGIIGVFAICITQEKFDVYYAVLCSLLVIFGFSRIITTVSFVVGTISLAYGFYRVSALLNVVCTYLFLLLYYMNP